MKKTKLYRNWFSVLSGQNSGFAPTVIMGILNITPDSFSDGGSYYNNVDRALKYVKDMYEDGADIVDIGGESSRPGSEQVSEEEELSRVIPVIEAVRKKLGEKVFLSIDTYKAGVAREALSKGVDMVNSLGGFIFDRDLANVAAEFGCPVILYHINGEPKTMQSGEISYADVVGDISDFFMKQIDFGLRSGMRREQFILDPGIGFGKTVEQNVEIIRRLNEFAALELPLAVGVSRKSHLGELLKEGLQLAKLPKTSQRLEAGLAETAIAVLNGASIVRTHDVIQTKRFLSVLDLFK